MISKELLSIVSPRPSDTGGLVYSGGVEGDGMILGGEARSPATGETYHIKDGYLDLLKSAPARTVSPTSLTSCQAQDAATSPSGASIP